MESPRGGPAPQKAGKFAVFHRGLTPLIPNLGGPSVSIRKPQIFANTQHEQGDHHFGAFGTFHSDQRSGPSWPLKIFWTLCGSFMGICLVCESYKTMGLLDFGPQFFSPACLRNGARNFEMSQHVTISQQNTFCAPSMPVSLRDSSVKDGGYRYCFRFSFQASLH